MYHSTTATLISSIIENINMQMEAETADLLDRRMMQLLAVSKKKLDKSDVTNGT
jgi:hypothetical protein